MFSFIKKLFLKKDDEKTIKIDTKNEFIDNDNTVCTKVQINEEEIETRHFNKTLKEDEYLLWEQKDKIYNHYKHKINLLDGQELTKEEKKELGLNSRLKVTKEFLEIFDKNKLSEINPKEVYKSFYILVNRMIMYEKDVLKSKEIGIKEVKIKTDFAYCSWCKTLDSKVYSIDEALQLVKFPKCTCNYILEIKPIINY